MSAPARRKPRSQRDPRHAPRPTPRPVAYHDDAPREGSRQFSDGSVAPVLLTSFDVSEYTRSVPGRIDVDTDRIEDQIDEAMEDPQGAGPRDLAELHRDLAFLHALESAALTETRTMYSSWTANEARITAFLASWLWERHWWAHALEEILETLPPGPAHGRRRPRPGAALRQVYVERALPIVGPGWTRVAGEAVTAGHMARMAVQEGSLRAALEALLHRVEHLPEVRRVLSEVIERRTHSLDFFHLEAIARITRSRAEAITARLVLAVGGDPLRPAGQRQADEDISLPSIFRRSADRASLRSARYEITRLLPGPDAPGLLGPIRAIRRGISQVTTPGGIDGLRP
ncbi:hypothetical protein [Brachybacterium endophyticum]|uniref:hypothetical protein n=1 Tax=Brachybacterium endophyticum TaxID=2182385 RepID=UPI00196A64B5|nr:hypothetical protein [Brachybacterium endophyticum]